MARTDRFAAVVSVGAALPDADPTEPVYEPATVELLRQVEAHARTGDVAWLKQHGKVYAAAEEAA